MKDSYIRIVDAMRHSAVMGVSLPFADVQRQMDSFFRHTADYWSVLCQYNQLKLLSHHRFNSEIPDYSSWTGVEIWGYAICDSLYRHYCRTEKHSSEEAFHADYWDKILERQAAGASLRIPMSMKEAAVSLAVYEKTVFRERMYYMTRLQLKKRRDVHLQMRQILRSNLEPARLPLEEAVDSVISGYATEQILRCLQGNSDRDAMELCLFLGLKIIPSLSGGRIEDDKRRGTCRLFESGCKCSKSKAQAGIDDILSGFAYRDFSSRKEMIQYWKDWLSEWDAADKMLEEQLKDLG